MPLQIAYIPFEPGENAYATRMRTLLGELGTVQRYAGAKPALLALLRGRRYDATVVNWYENEFVVDGRIAPGGIAKVFARTLCMRLTSRRLVFVRHNVYPHAVRPEQAAQARRWLDRYERLFHCVVTHGGHESGTHRHYAPHPLYEVQPLPPDAAAAAFVDTLPDDFFLMFGRMLPYKKIEQIAAGFPTERTLVAAGPVQGAYGEQLARLASERPNFLLRPGFLSEGTAQATARRAQAIVIAHAEDNVVVSGSFFYALTLGVPVIACRTPFLAWAQRALDTDLLMLADTPAQLCEIARSYRRPPLDPARWQRTLQHFGDAEVLRCWRECLGRSAAPQPEHGARRWAR